MKLVKEPFKGRRADEIMQNLSLDPSDQSLLCIRNSNENEQVKLSNRVYSVFIQYRDVKVASHFKFY